MKDIMTALVVGMIALMGHLIIQNVVAPSILTGTDAATNLVRTMYPMVDGFCIIFFIVTVLFAGLSRLLKAFSSGDGGMEG